MEKQIKSGQRQKQIRNEMKGKHIKGIFDTCKTWERLKCLSSLVSKSYVYIFTQIHIKLHAYICEFDTNLLIVLLWRKKRVYCLSSAAEHFPIWNMKFKSHLLPKKLDVSLCSTEHKPEPQLSYFSGCTWKDEFYSSECLCVTQYLYSSIFYRKQENFLYLSCANYVCFQKMLEAHAVLKYMIQNSPQKYVWVHICIGDPASDYIGEIVQESNLSAEAITFWAD